MKQIRRLHVIFIGFVIGGIFSLLATAHASALQRQATEDVTQFLFDAQELLEQFQFQASLNLLDQAIQHSPTSPSLHKQRGNVLMILRQNQEALAAYRNALRLAPNWLEGHWALWAILNRLSINQELELDTLFHIANLDSNNPLSQIRVARKLGELERFEESVVYFRRAVQIDSSHLAYRLFLARALFDIRNTDAAQQEVQWVLSHAAVGSPVHIAAQNLVGMVTGGTADLAGRSDFFESTKQLHGEEGKDYKRWALSRGQAWQFMEAGNFLEAATTWENVLALDPEDDLARYHLGRTLLKLKRYEEAIASFQASFQQSKQPPFYPDAIFQIGQAYAKLEQWGKAIVNYQQVLDIQELKEEDFYALNFPNVHVVEAALKGARTHVTNIPESQMVEETAPTPHRPEPSKIEELPLARTFPDSSPNLLKKSQTPLRVLPLSVNVVRGWFRQLVTAKGLGQDDLQAGFHEYIPLDPGDTFPPNQPRIYLVFALTTPPFDAKQISTQWVVEQVEKESPNTVMGTDVVLVGLNDSTGYFFVDQPEGGWPIGTYRIDLFVGEEVSPYTYVADVRFRIHSEKIQTKKP